MWVINAYSEQLLTPPTVSNFAFDFALCKLYTNALMSTLNARAGWNKLATGHAEHNLLFGTEYSSRSIASRNAEVFLSIFLCFVNPDWISAIFRLTPSPLWISGFRIGWAHILSYLDTPMSDSLKASMGADGVSHLAYAYEMQSPTTMKVSPLDLEYGVSVTKEVSTKADPFSPVSRTGISGDEKPS